MRTIRSILGMTQKQLASALGINRRTVAEEVFAYWESDKEASSAGSRLPS